MDYLLLVLDLVIIGLLVVAVDLVQALNLQLILMVVMVRGVELLVQLVLLLKLGLVEVMERFLIPPKVLFLTDYL